MIITAKFPATCPCCRGAIAVGGKIEWTKGAAARHVACASSTSTAIARPARPTYRRHSGGGSAASVPGYSSYCTGRSGCGCYDCAS